MTDHEKKLYLLNDSAMDEGYAKRAFNIEEVNLKFIYVFIVGSITMGFLFL